MKPASALALILSLTAGPAWTDEIPTYTGDDVVVTASRFLQARKDNPVNLSVITQEDIQKSPARTLPELLATLPGINSRDLFGNNATSATVDIRGFGAVAKQNTLVLIDGRQLNDVDLSAVQWSSIPLASVERIEVLRGSGAVLYGGGASGGVINIITKSPLADGNHAAVDILAGSYDTVQVQANANLVKDRFGMNVTASRFESDGYRVHNDNSQNNILADLRWYRDHGHTSLKLSADRQNVELPGGRLVQPSAGLNELESDRRGTRTPKDWATRDGNAASLLIAEQVSTNTEAIGELSFREKDQRAFFDFNGFPDFRATQLDLLTFNPRVKHQYEVAGKPATLVVGVDIAQWRYDMRKSNSAENVSQPINHVSATQNNVGVYFQNQAPLTDRLTLTFGARSEVQRLKANDEYDASAPGAGFGSAAPGGSQKEHEYAAEAGVRYRFAPQSDLYARAGRSFRFANVDEIYESSPTFTQQFQFLKPQTSNDREIGLDIVSGKNRSHAALFHMDVDDEIRLDPYSTGIGNTNLPPIRRYGLELEQVWRASESLTLRGGYTYTIAKFRSGTFAGSSFTRTNVDLAGKTVPLVPKHQADLIASYKLGEGTDLNTAVRYVSSQYMDNDEPNDLGTRIPSYTVVDVKLVHRNGPWTATLGVNNLFDKKYYTYAVRSTSTADRYSAYPLPERNFTASVGYRF